MDDAIPAAKRPRLSMACNRCRQRKVKCDTDQPTCRNCRLRSEVCTTTDPKMPHVPVTREWIVQPDNHQRGDSASGQMSVIRGITEMSSHSSGPLTKRPEIAQSPHSPAVSIQLWPQDTGISPAQQPYEVAFNTDARTDRIKMLGGSSSQCLMKSLDVYLESSNIPPLSHNFQHGMRYAEEMEIPLVSSLPILPGASHRNTYATMFFEKIHPLYPMFYIESMKNTIQELASLPTLQSLPHERVPLLVSCYLIMSLGADEDAKALTDDGTRYLVAAAGLLGQVMLMPYLHAVQALLLFTLAYRGRNKDGIGWQTLGMAIRIAYTLGLHRHTINHSPKQQGVQDRAEQLYHARIWAICCSLEKMMQLESGRPATIQHVERDHMIGLDGQTSDYDFLQWHVGLSQHQGLICHHIYGHRVGHRTAQQILSDTARLDRSLLSWAKAIPEEFRPGSDLFCSNSDFHIAAFFSMQYYQALITLHRAALIAPTLMFASEVAKHSFDEPARLRLLAGDAICVSSARSIARLTVELSDRDIQSRISSGGPQILACIVLGISLMKNHGSRIMAADLELLKACSENTAEHFLKSGHNAQFSRGLLSIHQQVRMHTERISRQDTGHAKPQGTVNPGPYHPTPREELAVAPYRDLLHQEGGVSYASREVTLPAAIHVDTNHYATLPHDGGEMNIGPPIEVNTASHPFHTDALPFDNLNVQELWDWMGDLSGYESYTHQESYGE